jgi:hypothetical protein
MTPQILLKIYSTLNLFDPLDLHFWSAAISLFFSFSRKGNLLPPSQEAFCHDKHVCRCDLSFDQDYVVVRMRYSKTNQFKDKAVYIPMCHIPDSVLSPVTFLAVIMTVAKKGCGPLFEYKKGDSTKVLTYPVFVDKLKKCLDKLGYTSADYSSHSFRRGGATFALACQVPADLIKLQGDWASQAYQKYLEPDIDCQLSVTRVMAQALK